MKDSYDLILVGTSFASSFFLYKYLEKIGPKARVLVLERGKQHPHSYHVKHAAQLHSESSASIRNLTPEKPWVFTNAFGGGSNCWWACTPRFHPSDFRLRSLYGIGVDWPISYEDLEPYYAEAEAIMQVAGGGSEEIFPRSMPFPQPPHRLSDPDRALAKAYPGLVFSQPCARTREATKNRPRCCATGVCGSCPIDAKFTVQNEIAHLYQDPRVELLLGAEALAIDIAASRATGVRYRAGEGEHVARGDLVALGANAIFNAALLLRSGVTHPVLGKHLNEQVARMFLVDLATLDNFQGSTSITGHGYMLYDGEHRRDRSAVLMEYFNIPTLRLQQGKWRKRLMVKCLVENSGEMGEGGSVEIAPDGTINVRYPGHSSYAMKALRDLDKRLPDLLGPLGVERLISSGMTPNEGHLLGSTRMAAKAEEGVLDSNLMVHDTRNVLVLGGGAFPTSTPANPTLTLSALSLRSADRVLSSQS